MSDERDDGVDLGPAPPTSTTRAMWLAELRAISALAVPVVIQTSAQQGMTVTDQVFLGHLGTSELGAAALANAFTNLMWFFLLGFATALDTLGSHAYGAGDRRALVTCCITAAVLVTLLVAPVALGMGMGEAAGRALFGQDEHTAQLMGRFCNGLIPGMWPLMWSVVLIKYLQVQNIMLIPSLIAVATFLLNIAFNAALVRSIGFRGAALSTTLSRWAQFLLLAGAVWIHERRRRREASEAAEGEGAALCDVGASSSPPPATPLCGEMGVATPSYSRGELMLLVLDADGEVDALARAPAAAAPSEGSGCCKVAQAVAPPEVSAMAAGRRRQQQQQQPEAAGLEKGEEAPLLDATYAIDGYTGARSVGAAAAKGVAGQGHQEEVLAAEGRVWPACNEQRCVDRYTGAGGGGRSGGSGDAEGLRGIPLDCPMPGVQGGYAEAAEAAAAAAPSWREVYGECRAAMHPRVVGRFLRLGIPGGLSMAFEAGCFDFSTALAGRLGPVATAAHAAMLSVVTLTYLACPFALATAGSIRVGNLLGAGQPDAARRAGALAVALSGGFMALMAVIILATRDVLGYMFSTDPRVIEVFHDIAAFAALFQVSDGLMGSSQGVLRGCGHQHLTAVFNFLGFWVCGVLLGYLLCFKAGMGLNGLWAGISSGDTATGVLNLVAMSRIRWQKEADNAVARLKTLAEGAEEEQAMLGSSAARPCCDDIDGDGGRVKTGNAGAPPPVVGGGRSYAGGLKRVWSERRLGQVVAEARRRRELGSQGMRQDSVTVRVLRNLSSFFRKQRQQDDGDGGDLADAASRPRQLELLP